MLTTAELRWFYSGTLPPAIAHWFQQNDLGEHLELPEAREDVYLCIPECDYLGIKFRQGRLEIKWRQQVFDNFQFAQSEGKAEKWVKWTCADSTGEGIISKETVAKGPWVSVTKARSQRKYQVFAQSLVAVPINESIDQGCTVELAKLGVKGKAWWSLAFEAFGEETSLMRHLQVVADWVIQSYRGPKLLAEDSYAYPKWLSSICD
jgi:hypothetical protein